jgi:hypothetical protein
MDYLTVGPMHPDSVFLTPWIWAIEDFKIETNHLSYQQNSK